MDGHAERLHIQAPSDAGTGRFLGPDDRLHTLHLQQAARGPDRHPRGGEGGERNETETGDTRLLQAPLPVPRRGGQPRAREREAEPRHRVREVLRRDGRLPGLQIKTAVARLLHDEQPARYDPYRGGQGPSAEGRVRAVHTTSPVRGRHPVGDGVDDEDGQVLCLHPRQTGRCTMDSSQEQGRDRSRFGALRRHDERRDGLGEDRKPTLSPKIRSEGQEGATGAVAKENRKQES